MVKTGKIRDAEIDLAKVDAFNDFMIEKGAFVRIGDQLVQNPSYPYPYSQLFEEFKRKNG